MFDLIYHLVFVALYHRTRNVEHQECRRRPSKTITSRLSHNNREDFLDICLQHPATLRSSPDIMIVCCPIGLSEICPTHGRLGLCLTVYFIGFQSTDWRPSSTEVIIGLQRTFYDEVLCFSGTPTCLKDHWQLLWLAFFHLFPYLILDVPKYPLKVCN